MALDASTVTRHELIGLPATVRDAPNADLIGLSGDVVDETMQTLHLAAADETKVVPKRATTITFELPTGDRVAVDGDRLIARPARRTETGGGSIWRSA